MTLSEYNRYLYRLTRIGMVIVAGMIVIDVLMGSL
jgi:hypothetical protein